MVPKVDSAHVELGCQLFFVYMYLNWQYMITSFIYDRAVGREVGLKMGSSHKKKLEHWKHVFSSNNELYAQPARYIS